MFTYSKKMLEKYNSQSKKELLEDLIELRGALKATISSSRTARERDLTEAIITFVELIQMNKDLIKCEEKGCL